MEHASFPVFSLVFLFFSLSLSLLLSVSLFFFWCFSFFSFLLSLLSSSFFFSLSLLSFFLFCSFIISFIISFFLSSFLLSFFALSFFSFSFSSSSCLQRVARASYSHGEVAQAEQRKQQKHVLKVYPQKSAEGCAGEVKNIEVEPKCAQPWSGFGLSHASRPRWFGRMWKRPIYAQVHVFCPLLFPSSILKGPAQVHAFLSRACSSRSRATGSS